LYMVNAKATQSHQLTWLVHKRSTKASRLNVIVARRWYDANTSSLARNQALTSSYQAMQEAPAVSKNNNKR
jgi:hypothetical protein